MQQVVKAILTAKWYSSEVGSDAGSSVLIPLNATNSGALKVAITDPDNGAYSPSVNSSGEISVLISQNGNAADIGQPSDALSHTGLYGLTTRSIRQNYNGSTYERARGNVGLTALSSAARTASTNSADLTNYNGLGGHFIIDVTSITDTPIITPTIQGKCPVSGEYYDILVGSPISTVGTNVLKVHPGITGLANAAANDILPRTFRLSVAHTDADSITYSIGINLVT